MDIIHCTRLLCVVVCFGVFVCASCLDEFGDSTAVYIVTLKEPPSTTHYYGQLRQNTTSFSTSGGLSIHKARYFLHHSFPFSLILALSSSKLLVLVLYLKYDENLLYKTLAITVIFLNPNVGIFVQA